MKRRPQSTRGYTAIEVLMAMTVFAVGAAAIIGMQRASVQGNYDARQLDLANSLARQWVERIRRDAMLWTTPQAPTDFTATAFLKAPIRDSGKFELPSALCPSTTTISGALSNADGLCPAFDSFGRDLAQDHYADAAFCANIRVDTVANDISTLPGGPFPSVMRVVVRVYWPRGMVVAPFVNGGNRFCSTAALADTSTAGPDAPAALQIYHFVQAVTLVSPTLIAQ